MKKNYKNVNTIYHETLKENGSSYVNIRQVDCRTGSITSNKDHNRKKGQFTKKLRNEIHLPAITFLQRY